MQPVQLSLMPDQLPALLPALMGQLPAPQAEAAMSLLACLIAKAAAATAAAAGTGDCDE